MIMYISQYCDLLSKRYGLADISQTNSKWQCSADRGLWTPQLRSAHANRLNVLRTNTRLGDRSFSVAGPRIWNSLPASLWQSDIEFGHFKRLLKVFLFGETAVH